MKEITFRQWIAEDLSFNYETKLTFAQCDKNTNMTWAELLRLTSDCAVEDYNMRDMSWEFLMKHGVIFVVSRSSYHILQMPKAEEQITLQTWEEKASGPLFTRRFLIKDTLTGQPLITAYTLWTLINFESRKIIPEKEYTFRPSPTCSTPFDGIMPGRIKEVEGMEKIGSHKVVFTDTDSNGHANNSKYINFVLDCLPEKFQEMTYKEMRINYSKEATYGDTIDLYGKIDEALGKITVIGKVNDGICFENELYF